MSKTVGEALKEFSKAVYSLSEMVQEEARTVRENPLSVVPPSNPEITKAAVRARQATIDLESVCRGVKPPGQCLLRFMRSMLWAIDRLGTRNSEGNDTYSVGYKMALAIVIEHLADALYNAVYFDYPS